MKHILIAIDGSDHAARAAEHGAVLARIYGASVELLTSVFVSPLPMGPYNVTIPTDTFEVARQQARTRLEDMATALRGTGLEVTISAVHEDASSAICARAEETQADLIVMGTRGRTGLAHVIFGSVAERVARLAPCPVLIAHADSPAPGEIRVILVPTDFSEHADAALAFGRALAKRTGARLVVMHSTYLDLGGQDSLLLGDTSVRDAVEEDGRQRLAQIAAAIDDVEVETTSARAPADLAILDAEKGSRADLIVMGTRGRTGLAHVVLGSIAERVIRRAHAPVITLKAEEAE